MFNLHFPFLFHPIIHPYAPGYNIKSLLRSVLPCESLQAAITFPFNCYLAKLCRCSYLNHPSEVNSSSCVIVCTTLFWTPSHCNNMLVKSLPLNAEFNWDFSMWIWLHLEEPMTSQLPDSLAYLLPIDFKMKQSLQAPSVLLVSITYCHLITPLISAGSHRPVQLQTYAYFYYPLSPISLIQHGCFPSF